MSLTNPRLHRGPRCTLACWSAASGKGRWRFLRESASLEPWHSIASDALDVAFEPE